MKKAAFIFVLVFCYTLTSNAQMGNFRAGVHLGIPVGDASDFTSFTFGVDASYLWGVSDIFAVGVASGYASYPGKDSYSNYSFIPIAASGRVGFSDNWFAGADLGYAIATDNAGGDGGFYYQPKIGWTMDTFDIFVYYQGISIKDALFDITSIGVGAAIKL